MSTNEWRPVCGFEHRYEVNEDGVIRKVSTKRPISPSMANKYSHVTLCDGGRKKTIRVHRVVALAWLPKTEGKNHVNHINGNKHDNRACNLEWVTQAENNEHSMRVLGNVSPMIGCKYPKHEHPSQKVTKEMVKRFKEMVFLGVSTEVIGEVFGVNGSTVRKHLRAEKRKTMEVAA